MNNVEIRVGKQFLENFRVIGTTPEEKLCELIDNSIAAKGKKQLKVSLTFDILNDNFDEYTLSIKDNAAGMDLKTLKNNLSVIGNDEKNNSDSLNEHGVGFYSAVAGLGELYGIVSKKWGSNPIVVSCIKGNSINYKELKGDLHEIKKGTEISIFHGEGFSKGLFSENAKLDTSLDKLTMNLSYRYSKYLSEKDIQIELICRHDESSYTREITISKPLEVLLENREFLLNKNMTSEGVNVDMKLGFLMSDEDIIQTKGRMHPQIKSVKKYAPFKRGLNKKNIIIRMNGKVIEKIDYAELTGKSSHIVYGSVYGEIEVSGLSSLMTKNGFNKECLSFSTFKEMIKEMIKLSPFEKELFKRIREANQEQGVGDVSQKEYHNNIRDQIFNKLVVSKKNLKREKLINKKGGVRADMIDESRGSLYEVKTNLKLETAQLFQYSALYNYKRKKDKRANLNKIIYITPSSFSLTENQQRDIAVLEDMHNCRVVFRTFEDYDVA